MAAQLSEPDEQAMKHNQLWFILKIRNGTCGNSLNCRLWR